MDDKLISTDKNQLIDDDDVAFNIKPSKLDLSPMANFGRTGKGKPRTFFERTFSKLDRGSVRGSIFALSASAIGAGVLSLPYVLNLCGCAAGIFFMVMGATAANISLKMLAEIAVDHKLPNYSKIVSKAGGSKM